MKNRLSGNTLFVLLTLSAPVASGVDLPRLEDPKLAGWMKSIGEDYAKYLANPQAFFAKPAEAQPWPCGMSAADFNKLAGTVDLADQTPEIKQQWVRSMRGLGAEYVKSSYAYRNVQFYPVKVTCVQGKLDGETEFWVDYEHVSTMPAATTVNKFTVRHAYATVAGEVVGLRRQYSSTGSPDGSGSALFMYTAVDGGFAPSVTLIHILGQPSTFSVSTVRPLSGGRFETTSYAGATKWHVTTFKGGKQHGPQISYPRMMGTLKIPGFSRCFKDGEEYKADPCDVQ